LENTLDLCEKIIQRLCRILARILRCIEGCLSTNHPKIRYNQKKCKSTAFALQPYKQLICISKKVIMVLIGTGEVRLAQSPEHGPGKLEQGRVWNPPLHNFLKPRM